MREYRRRQQSALGSRPHARVLEPEYLPEPRPLLPTGALVPHPVAPMPSSRCCPYCSGSRRSSAGTVCSYCRPPALGAISRVRLPHGFDQDDHFSPLAVWVVVVGVVGVLGLMWWWWKPSTGGAARLDSSPPRTWAHWMEGVQL
jgi:hypothetical protein